MVGTSRHFPLLSSLDVSDHLDSTKEFLKFLQIWEKTTETWIPDTEPVYQNTCLYIRLLLKEKQTSVLFLSLSVMAA